jgi:hypothetical protein
MPTISDKKLLIPALISVVLHLTFMAYAGFLLPNSLGKMTIAESQKPIEVASISQEELKRIRTVGIKNGAKEFQSKVPPAKRQSPPPPQKLGLEELAPSQDVSHIRPTKTAPSKRVLNEPNEANPFRVTVAESSGPRQVEVMRRQKMKDNIIEQMPLASDEQMLLKNTGMDVHFEPPEGVSEDELNSTEKIYYSFQKRTFVSYVNSLITSYNRMVLSRPQLKQILMSETHSLTGRVTFDREGNIVSIKIIQSSLRDEVHRLFEETLKEIKNLPNPPKDFIKDDGFTIYYQLKING